MWQRLIFKRGNWIAVLLLLAVLTPSTFVLAQAPIVNCGPNTAEGMCTIGHLLQLPIRIFNFLLGLAGFVALIFIVWGALGMFYWGFMEDSPGELQNAKNTVRRAIGGLVIIMIAYVVVNTLILALSGGNLTINTLLQRFLPGG